MKESDVIAEYFRFQAGESVRVGIGDDAAVLDVAALDTLAVSADSLVESVHFLPDTPPKLLGRKCLSVGLSDLASMGASPLYATVALIHPKPRPEWLEGFAGGLEQAAAENGVTIVGGDLSSGGLVAISVTVAGKGAERPLLRSGAQAGDSLWVTGKVGEASLGLALLQGRVALEDKEIARSAIDRHQNPRARVEFGELIAPYANAAVDTSDGLWKSMRLVSAASKLGMEIDIESLPVSEGWMQSPDVPLRCALDASDDYELFFTTPAGNDRLVGDVARKTKVLVTKIGKAVPGDQVSFVGGEKEIADQLEFGGHEHWS